jgi:uncharacterized RDD family membrane protein YckC
MTRAPAELYLGKKGEMRREIVTPEGIPLRVVLADAGSRAGAFILDLLLMGLILFALLLGAHFLLGAFLHSGWTQAFLQLVSFLIFTFYFPFFELRWQGATPGKRALGLRVIDAEGGQLTAGAILGRNLVRNIEFWIPAAILMAPEQLGVSQPGLLRFFTILWLLILAFFPLFNRDRLRVGDLVAGTVVVLAPRAFLLPDIGGKQTTIFGSPEPTRFRFTDKQLDVYGIFELQVLERVLRGDGLGSEAALDAVYQRIRRKIGFDPAGQAVDVERFLRDFYAALRARLERKMLFGERKQDKYSR